MECTNCCSEGGWSPRRAVLADGTEIELVLCEVCCDALCAEEWIEIENAAAPNS